MIRKTTSAKTKQTTIAPATFGSVFMFVLLMVIMMAVTGVPFRCFFLMAEQAGIRAFFGSETFCHLRVRDIVNFMRSHLAEKSLYNPRHVTRDATACL